MRQPFIVATSLLGKAILGVVLGVALSTSVEAQSTLENPAPGSFQSGIGLVSGWKCTAGTVTVSFDGGPPLEAAYGTSREDTRPACGDANNGFGLLWNFNLLGDGQHTVRLFDNGAQFAEATFTVSTFGGEEFLPDARRTLTTGFGGCQTTLQWQESQQNFAIAATDACFQFLLGQWEFVTNIPGGDEIDLYQFEQIETLSASGEEIEVVTGTDLDHGGPVVILRTTDIIAGSVGYDFFAASLFSSRCEAFLFNQVGPDAVQGVGASYPADPVFGCQEIPSPLPEYPMTGTRTGTALSQQQTTISSLHTQLRGQAQTAEEASGVLADLLEKASHMLRKAHP